MTRTFRTRELGNNPVFIIKLEVQQTMNVTLCHCMKNRIISSHLFTKLTVKQRKAGKKVAMGLPFFRLLKMCPIYQNLPLFYSPTCGPLLNRP